MANFYSEFALQQDDDELVFQNIVSSFVCEQRIGQEDSVTNYASLGHDVSNFTISNNKRKRQRSSAFRDDNKESAWDEKLKRIVHRDIERKRRQEMATLFASLRNLLPLVYLEGTRSSSDIILEAANYIKHMHKNIKELRGKRDKLKKLIAASDLDSRNRSLCSRLPINVTARSCSVGIEILISGDHFRNDTVLLSKVLEVALADGLNVVSCVSTKANERTLHRIVSEVGHLGGIDMNELQQKLTDIVNPQISRVVDQ